jgi:hypothetical protein
MASFFEHGDEPSGPKKAGNLTSWATYVLTKQSAPWWRQAGTTSGWPDLKTKKRDAFTNAVSFTTGDFTNNILTKFIF